MKKLEEFENSTNNTFHMLFSNVLNTTVLNLTSGDKTDYVRAEEILRYYSIYLLTMSRDREKFIIKLRIKGKDQKKQLLNKLNNMRGKNLFLFFCNLMSEAGIKPIYEKPLIFQQSFFSKIQKKFIELENNNNNEGENE